MFELIPDRHTAAPTSPAARRQRAALAGACPRAMRRVNGSPDADTPPHDPELHLKVHALRLARQMTSGALATQRDQEATLDLHRWRRVLAGGLFPAFTPAEFDLIWSMARPTVCQLFRDHRRKSQTPVRLKLASSPSPIAHLRQAKGDL
jgi:hypothetical protein